VSPSDSDGDGDNPNPPSGDFGNYVKFPFTRDFTSGGSEEQSAGEFDDFDRFRQPQFRYELIYPKDWKVNEPRELDGAVLIEEPQSGSGFIFASPLPLPGNSETLVSQDLGRLANQVRSVRTEQNLWSNVDPVKTPNTLTTREREMLVLNLRYEVKKSPVQEKVGLTSAEFGNVIIPYIISIFANADRYSQLDEMATEVVDSFQILQ
jgi:hypothetical protein